MNKLFSITIISVLTLFLVFNTNESAQAQNLDDSILVTNPGDIIFGVGLSRGTSVGFLDNPEFGISGQFYYTVNEEIRGGVDYTYYLIGERELSASELNFNVHYFVRNRDGLTLYGLGGVNVSNTSGNEEKWLEQEDRNPDTRKLGLNFGAGLEIRIGDVVIYGEPKATLFGGSQFALTGCVRYIL